jgi:hypothetical protein
MGCSEHRQRPPGSHRRSDFRAVRDFATDSPKKVPEDRSVAIFPFIFPSFICLSAPGRWVKVQNGKCGTAITGSSSKAGTSFSRSRYCRAAGGRGACSRLRFEIGKYFGRLPYHAVQPPSISRFWPVMKLPASLARSSSAPFSS